MSRQDIYAKAIQLPADEREALALDLLDTVLPGEIVGEAEWLASWRPELERRIKDIDEGRTKLIPAEEALAELRRRLAIRS